MPFPVEKLDLQLAWRRVKSDLQARVFVRPPLEVELVEQAEAEWLEELRNKVAAGYNPHSPVVAEVPKGNGAVRPAVLLHLDDRVVYAAALGAMLVPIYEGLQWSQGGVDFSYRLSGQPRRVSWFTDPFHSWSAFRKASINRIDEGASHVVMTDLTGFYENVDLNILFSDLRFLGCDSDVLGLLQTCLNRWCLVSGRGLPQGLSPSDVLAKVYMNSIDRRMIDGDWDYIRYVDDMRVFCPTIPASKIALLQLTQACRRRGLNLQAAKTSIASASAAKKEFEGIAVEIAAVQKKFKEFLTEMLGEIDPYMSIAAIEENVDADDAPMEIVRGTFKKNFLRGFFGPPKRFNKTLFHYLLNRLGKQADAYAADYCIEQLTRRPEETQPILDYFASINENEKVFAGLDAFLESPDNIYDYQVYQIYGWLIARAIKPTDKLIAIARKITFDGSKPAYLRAVCRTVLQEYGTPSDLDLLEASYGSMHDEWEKAQVLASLKRMEVGRRNSFYGRVVGDGLLCRLAIKLVKAAK